ncbi:MULTISPECIES: MFS transporter [unclassified Oceanobacter]|jgi:YNFM family putative membrane transporter|uniref:MFS transporter n=1 Tax=unclassified Oceanobacter TaxID=2620260 RepID=UPI0026E14F83|nr:MULTISPECIES: MFS transporter [unclassified Oceanobacter]MDO6681445.1 MFS transporter [Oceanobacter sp. 5_MG-2023]MDP2506731.1 MFS transporter [Oceanobacter sp. 3_MG-2023]MDP2548727.1 MFS transporter [Oceanobacter sp. 4_MG-2023]
MIKNGTAAWWRITIALCLGSFMVFSNLYVTQPLLPMLATEFAVTPLQASYTLTLSTLTLGLSLLIYGPLSDVIGRKGLIIGSMCGVAATTLVISQVTTFEQLLWLRGLQGLFLGGLPAIAVAYMADEFEADALMSAIGLYIAANSLGGIGGRLMGGFAGEHLGWGNAFLLVGLVGLCTWMLVAWLLPPPRRFTPRPFNLPSMGRDIVSHLRNPLLLPAFLFGGLNFFVFINQYSFITFVLEDDPYQLSPQFLGMLFLTYLSGTWGSMLSGKFSRRYGQPNCMMVGSGLLMVGSLITLYPSLPTIIFGFLVNAFGFFFAHSSASAWVGRTVKHAKASASSLYLVCYYLGASTGGVYLNQFWQWQYWLGVVLGSWLILAVTLSLAARLKYLHNQQQARQPAVNPGTPLQPDGQSVS